MLIAIEGTDGSGKRTQSRLLTERAEQAGLLATTVSFPRYGQTVFAHTITDYLNGSRLDMGLASARYTALLYAGDRFESRADDMGALGSPGDPDYRAPGAIVPIRRPQTHECRDEVRHRPGNRLGHQ